MNVAMFPLFSMTPANVAASWGARLLVVGWFLLAGMHAVAQEPTSSLDALDDPAQLMTPLSSISWRPQDTTSISTGSRMPRDYAAAAFADSAGRDEIDVLTRYWEPNSFRWTPTAFWRRPLYFEDDNLERHGLSFGVAQPAVSAARFLGQTLALPYQLVDQHPHERVYDLGHCRAGNCVPYFRRHRPLNLKAGVAEAGTVVGLVFLIP